MSVRLVSAAPEAGDLARLCLTSAFPEEGTWTRTGGCQSGNTLKGSVLGFQPKWKAWKLSGGLGGRLSGREVTLLMTGRGPFGLTQG